MATMNISLPDEMKAFVETQAAKEGFGTTSEYLRSVIRDVQKRQAKQVLEAKLREALESGPSEPMTREDWDESSVKVLSGSHASGPSDEPGHPSPPQRPPGPRRYLRLSRAYPDLLGTSLPARGQCDFPEAGIVSLSISWS
jgi:antitoxin ParD1/3/4